jgi:TatD DNase family protein
MPTPLFDIGANLTNRAFHGDLAAVLERARAAGLVQIAVTGTSVAASTEAADLARSHPGFLCATAGVHPHDAAGWNVDSSTALRALAARPEVVALGECGLDFHRNYAPRDAQLACFTAQVELACELGLPLFVHDRDASAEVADVLARHRDRFPAAVVHCFTGDRAALDRYLALDLHIGITGWVCDERRGTHLHELLPGIPLDRLMVETDAPYLLPRTLRPAPANRCNEPAFLPQVVETIARCLDRPFEAIARATTETARRFFGLPG